jgi:hypothetical protein
LLIGSWADRNRCAWPGDLKRFICALGHEYEKEETVPRISRIRRSAAWSQERAGCQGIAEGCACRNRPLCPRAGSAGHPALGRPTIRRASPGYRRTGAWRGRSSTSRKSRPAPAGAAASPALGQRSAAEQEARLPSSRLKLGQFARQRPTRFAAWRRQT